MSARSISVACAVLVLSFGVTIAGDPSPEKVRVQILELTNEFRKAEKKAPLVVNSKLASAAQKHADNMARQDKIGDDAVNAHILDGKGPKDRVDAEGYSSAAGAENLAVLTQGSPKMAGTVMDGWKGSPKHRENLLSEMVTEIGVGVARSKSGKWYFCQEFGMPR